MTGPPPRALPPPSWGPGTGALSTGSVPAVSRPHLSPDRTGAPPAHELPTDDLWPGVPGASHCRSPLGTRGPLGAPGRVTRLDAAVRCTYRVCCFLEVSIRLLFVLAAPTLPGRGPGPGPGRGLCAAGPDPALGPGLLRFCPGLGLGAPVLVTRPGGMLSPPVPRGMSPARGPAPRAMASPCMCSPSSQPLPNVHPTWGLPSLSLLITVLVSGSLPLSLSHLFSAHALFLL